MSVPDPYKVLQVDPEAEDEVIEAAYRRLARKYHPDVSPDPESQERMVRINQAWELLREPVKRAAVDRARARSAGVAARVAAADARAARSTGPGPEHASSATGPTQPRARAGHPAGMRPPGWSGPGPGGAASRPVDPGTQVTSPDWTSGRSNTGGGYDPSSMGAAQGFGTAGPPPGNPSGSVLNFGRYAGWSLGEIARSDLEYLEWLDRTPIGRGYQVELDELLRAARRRVTASSQEANRRGLFRRR